MADDIDKVLINAQLHSKFMEAVEEFSDLITVIDQYADAEELKIVLDDDLREDEISALELIASNTKEVEEDLKRVKDKLGCTN